MLLFIAQCSLQDLTETEWLDLKRCVTLTCTQFTRWQRPVRLVRSLLTPSEADCIFLFEGTEAAHVRDACEAAQLPFRRIVEVIE